jgi:hypothetical protein
MPNQEVMSLSLALQDYVQIVFAAIGLYYLSRMIFLKNIACGNLSLLGIFFILLGLLSQATWKLFLAINQVDSIFLNNSLYVFLSAGFICFSWALWKSNRRNEAMTDNAVWGIPIFLFLFVWAVAGYSGIYFKNKIWFTVLQQVTVFAEITLFLQLIYYSLSSQLWFASCLFIVSLIITVSWGYTDQAFTTLFSKQYNTTFAQVFFAFASWILLKKEKHLWQRLSQNLRYYLRLFRFIFLRK